MLSFLLLRNRRLFESSDDFYPRSDRRQSLLEVSELLLSAHRTRVHLQPLEIVLDWM